MKTKHCCMRSCICIIFIFSGTLFFAGCKKGKFDSKYTKLLQHTWQLESVKTQRWVNGSIQTPWENRPITAATYWSFSEDGTFTFSVPSIPFSYSNPYEIRSDDILLFMHPATVGIPYSDPDTNFIKSINESVMVIYYRKFFGSGGYVSLDETLTILKR